MKRSKNIWLVLVTILTTISPLLGASPSLADEYCQCVRYVRNAQGINTAIGNAKDYADNLPSVGFYQIFEPQQGAIIVMQPSFPGSDRTYGHVGIIDHVDEQGRVYVRGANQGSRDLFSEAGCNNVNVIRFRTPITNRNDVTFWTR